jgi:hypothetical protein
LLPRAGGYSVIDTWYNVDEMAAATVERVIGKSANYGKRPRPLHLLLYSTDWRLTLAQNVMADIASGLAQRQHVFTTITYVSPDGQGLGILAGLFPIEPARERQGSKTPSFVVFGDIRKPTVESDGSVSIPVPLPPLSQVPGLVDVGSRIWVSPVLCGCELSIVAYWGGEPPVVDGESRQISYRHPVPGTVRSVGVINVCSAHDHFRIDGPLDETYGGFRSGYLRREPTTEAERLYVGLQRYNGQRFEPDTCQCRIYQVSDCTDPGSLVAKPHSLVTRKCATHAMDTDDHRDAIENMQRKNCVASHLMKECSLAQEDVTWRWDDERTLLVSALGVSLIDRAALQVWCDATVGLGKVSVV